MQIYNALIFLAATLTVTLPESDVTLIDGNQIKGEITALTDNQLTITSGDQSQELVIDQLQQVTLSTDDAIIGAENQITVRLHDGSTLYGKSVLATATNARVTISDDVAYRLKSDSLANIQFKPLSEQAQKDFDAVLKADSAGDVLIVLRPGGAIDELEGIIERVDSEAVTFNFDGDRIPVELEKLAGIKLLKPGSLEIAKTLGQVHDLQGNIWQARRFQLNADDQTLQFETGLGDAISLKLDKLQRLNFASSSVAYLSDLTPESAEWTPYLTGRLIRNRLNQIYAPAKDRSANGGELIIGDQVYAKGLSLRSKTELVYRLTDDFSKLQLTAGLAETAKGRGHVELIILGDNKQLFQDFIVDPEDIRELELDMTGIRRLSITVDYGKNLDFGDLLNLGDARLIK